MAINFAELLLHVYMYMYVLKQFKAEPETPYLIHKRSRKNFMANNKKQQLILTEVKWTIPQNSKKI